MNRWPEVEGVVKGILGTKCYPGLGSRVEWELPEMEVRDVHTMVPEGKVE